MATLPELQVRVRLHWWFRAYLAGLVTFCAMFRAEPNWERVCWWFMHGHTVEVWTGSRWRRIYPPIGVVRGPF